MIKSEIIWFHLLLGLGIIFYELAMNNIFEVTFWTMLTSAEWMVFKKLGLIS
ncbi:hypothetical protein LVD15_03335 [Fulvivirga maritima]|uniref:hypothetical protein n=1 Tax=Fulvivirga maritima TaxID=2904247 RepID=UPI001F306AC6|nr:hypothetical protein [Fulvivirga maritima]UII27479.1 hypothetical protein LVD15_03335 [Fulvivirga maritima]